MVSEKRTFHTLDGMRGAAALLVLNYHVGYELHVSYRQGSYLAVDLFFALSGFVLAHAYGQKLSGGMGVFEFMRLRFIRLYPLYLAGTIGGIAVLSSGLLASGGRLSYVTTLIASLAGLPAIAHGGAYEHRLYPFDAAAWSLFFEVVINLALALVWNRLSLRTLAFMLLCGAVAIVLLASSGTGLDAGSRWTEFAVGSARVFYSFFAGVLVYKWRMPLPRIPAWAVIGCMLVLFSIPVPHHWRPYYDAVAILIGVPVLVSLGAVTEPGKRLHGLCRFVGITSYAVYVIHYPLLPLMHPVLERFPFVPPAVMDGAFTIVIITAAWLLDRFYDQPVRRFLTRAKEHAKARTARLQA